MEVKKDMNEKELKLVEKVLEKGTQLFEQTNYSSKHTVVAGIISETGNIYLGANCDSVHGTCAEVVAYVNAIMANDKQLKTIVAASARGQGYDRILSPCGNCRQILMENTPNIDVILCEEGKLKKFPIVQLLPKVYKKK